MFNGVPSYRHVHPSGPSLHSAGSEYSRPPDLLDDGTLSWPRPVFPDDPKPGFAKALPTTDDVMKGEVIPLFREFVEQQPLTVWKSRSFAILFSIDVLIDTLAYGVQDQCVRSGALNCSS